MLSSWQIAAMHSQQGQMFGAQQAYSQQISAPMPPPYQGLGATGFGGGFNGGSAYNYGGSGFYGYGPGNSLGNAATSFVGGMGHAMAGAMPFIGGFAGFRSGGIGGALTGFGVGAAFGGAMNHVSGSFMEGAHEQAQIERTLSQFQFQNAASRTGRGFSRSDAMAIGNMVRQMERIPEMLTSFGELNRIMDKMGQMGLMQGVRDVADFTKKFRDTVGALKDMAKVLGTTMEGALQAFGEARRSGFYGQGDIVRNALNRQITSSLTGMNQGQVGALQMFGAELGHSAGGSRRTGAQLAIRTAGQLGMANRLGILTNDQIVEMTGKEGAEGIQELAADMSQLSYRMSRSSVGTALTLALGEVRNGRFTGRMDQELVERVRSGELGLSELRRMARSKARTRGAKLSFAAHRDRLTAEMAGSVGSEGLAMQLQEILGDRGWDNPDAVNLVMQRFGATEEQANLLQQMMPNLGTIGSQMNLTTRHETRRAAQQAVAREHGWDAIKHKIGKKLAHITTDWAKDLGVGVRDYFQNWADEFLDDLSGTYRQHVTKRVMNEFKYSTSGRARLISQATDVMSSLGGTRLDVGSSGGLSGLAARAIHSLSGRETAGELALSTIKEAGLGGLVHSGAAFDPNNPFASTAERLSRQGKVVLDSSIFGGASAIDRRDIGRIREGIAGLGGSRGEAIMRSLQGSLSASELGQLDESFRRAMSSGSISQITDQTERARAIIRQMGGRSGIAEAMNDPRRFMLMRKASSAAGGDLALLGALQSRSGGFRGDVDFGAMASGVLGLDLSNARGVSKLIEDTNKDLNSRFKGSDSEASWAEVRKVLDEGGEMGRVFEAMVGSKGADIRSILSKKVLSEDDKEILRSRGIDPEKLISKMSTSEGLKEIDRMMVTAGKMSPADLDKYLRGSAASSLIAYSDSLHERGRAAAERLTSKSNEEAKRRLMNSKEGYKAVLALQTSAARFKDAGVYTRADGTQGFRDVNDDTDDLVAMYRGMSRSNQKDMYRLGSDEFRASVDFANSLRDSRNPRRGKLARARGQSVQDILDIAGMSDAPDEYRKQLEDAISKGKSKGLDKEEIENVIKILVEANSKGLTGKSGTEQKSAMASEAEVAKSLASLSDNNVKIAAILSGIATGKSVADSLKDLNK